MTLINEHVPRRFAERQNLGGASQPVTRGPLFRVMGKSYKNGLREKLGGEKERDEKILGTGVWPVWNPSHGSPERRREVCLSVEHLRSGA